MYQTLALRLNDFDFLRKTFLARLFRGIIKALQTVSLNLLINQSADESRRVKFTGQIRHVNKADQKAA